MFDFLSDIDGLSVEWETPYGRFWTTYASDEEMDSAIRKNEEYNNLPENKARIEADERAQQVMFAKYDFEYYGGLDYCTENNIKLEVQGAVNMCKKYGMEAVKVVTGMVMAHNKRVMQTRVVPAVATNTLGDFLLA